MFLEKKDTSYMAAYYDTPGTQSGFPKYYANWDAEFWVVAPTPDSTYEITLAYVKQPISINQHNTTNEQQILQLQMWVLIYPINIRIYFCMDVW